MVTRDAIAAALQAGGERLGELDAEYEAWSTAWDGRTEENAFALMKATPFDYQARRRLLVGEVLHLRVLADALQHDFTSSAYAPGCEPAFALDYDQVQVRLGEWLQDVVTRGDDILPDSQRLLLGWCAQLLTIPNSSGHDQVLYPGEFLDSARSIYAYAIGPDLVAWHNGIIGRNGPDARLILALTAFPFLEGVVRRRLAGFMTPDGKVHRAFDVPQRNGNVKNYKVDSRCNSVQDALFQLEASVPGSDLAGRLKNLRADISSRGVQAEATQKLSPGEHDLYKLIQDHRNSNLHGGLHVVHIGLAALLLATMIALSEIESHFDACRDFGLMVVRVHAPVKPQATWSHIAYYPVAFTSAHEDQDVHCWRR